MSLHWPTLIGCEISERVRKPWTRVVFGVDGDKWANRDMTVIWSCAEEQDGRWWLHVSAARPGRIPSYLDMAWVKELFVGPDRIAYSVWAPAARHITIHDNCLHLWAPLEGEPPLPDFARGGDSI